MKKIKKLVAVIGTYSDAQGNQKNQYVNAGSLFQRDDGSMCIKLDSLPLGEWNGWLNAYVLDENRQQNNQQGMAQARAAAQPDQGGLDDRDIPFSNYEYRTLA